MKPIALFDYYGYVGTKLGLVRTDTLLNLVWLKTIYLKY